MPVHRNQYQGPGAAQLRRGGGDLPPPEILADSEVKFVPSNELILVPPSRLPRFSDLPPSLRPMKVHCTILINSTVSFDKK